MCSSDLVLVVGVPVALIAAFGAPWPDSVPSLDVLSRPTSADTLLGVLAVVVWLAWLHFVVCLAVEAVAEVRHRGLAPRVPGGSIGTQYLARKVVVAIALLIGTAVATVGPVAAANAAPATPGVTSSVSATAVGGSSSTAATDAPAASTDASATRAAASDQKETAGLPKLGDLESATARDQAQGVTTYYKVQQIGRAHV